MAQNFKGKVAVVTGSTSGIGLGIAHLLASRGASVVLTGLGKEEETAKLLQEFQSKYKGTFHFVPGDFLVTQQTEKFAQDVLSIYPNGIDILVNNAGLVCRYPVEKLSTEVWLNSLAVNLTAPFLLTRAFFPLMKKNGWGRIINMSSQMGLIASDVEVGYCAPKAGLVGMSRAVALEGAAHGVTCNAICPSYVEAPMCLNFLAKEAAESGVPFEKAKDDFEKTCHPMGRLIPISEVAELVAFLCSDAASCISGTPIPIDGANMAR